MGPNVSIGNTWIYAAVSEAPHSGSPSTSIEEGQYLNNVQNSDCLVQTNACSHRQPLRTAVHSSNTAINFIPVLPSLERLRNLPNEP